MTEGISVGRFRSVNIISYTRAYSINPFCGYIEKALTYVPEDHMRHVESISIYDNPPSHFSAKGAYYSSTSEKGAEISIYLDQNLGHMMSLHKSRNLITDLLDVIFVRCVGKRFIVNTLFHEIGHHVYQVILPSGTGVDDKEASEEYADKYATDLYGKVFPLSQKCYGLANMLYHLIYSRRIAKDNEILDKTKV